MAKCNHDDYAVPQQTISNLGPKHKNHVIGKMHVSRPFFYQFPLIRIFITLTSVTWTPILTHGAWFYKSLRKCHVADNLD